MNGEHIEAMRAVRGGADIYNFRLARLLRQVEKEKPGLVEIGKAMMYRGNGADTVPYFGAILTDSGSAYLTAWEAVNREYPSYVCTGDLCSCGDTDDECCCHAMDRTVPRTQCMGCGTELIAINFETGEPATEREME